MDSDLYRPGYHLKASRIPFLVASTVKEVLWEVSDVAN